MGLGLRKKSLAAFESALKVIPGGVSSPVRAFGSVEGKPLFIASGNGSRITDVDGNAYIDYVASWGPLILGHAPRPVLSAISETAQNGTTFGAPTELETRLAEKVVAAVKSIEKVRFVSSGTEATMSAVRLARGYTGRSRIIKFEGCYHGHADPFLVAAGSGVMTLGTPGSPGVTGGTVEDTTALPYNNIDAFKEAVDARGDEIACVIVEPVAANMGVIPPADGFLETLRVETEKRGIVLIFDEVVTGFRLAPGGAQEVFGIEADLTTLGKVLGGGLPAAAFGGKAGIMDRIAPDGPVYQAGTLSGNPLAMAAGAATLDAISKKGFYAELEEKAGTLASGLEAAFSDAGIPACINRIGSMMTVFFTKGPVKDYNTALASDDGRFIRWHSGMLEKGVYLAPSRFEAAFVSDAHTPEDIENTIEAARKTAAGL